MAVVASFAFLGEGGMEIIISGVGPPVVVDLVSVVETGVGLSDMVGSCVGRVSPPPEPRRKPLSLASWSSLADARADLERVWRGGAGAEDTEDVGA